MAEPIRFDILLTTWFKRHGLQKRLRRHQALQIWSEIVGEGTARHSQAVDWQGDALIVMVDHPAWAQQLSMMREPLMQRMNSRLGTKTVRDLRFRVVARNDGKWRDRAAETGRPGDNTRAAGAAFPPQQGERRSVPAWIKNQEIGTDRTVERLHKVLRVAVARVENAECRCCRASFEAADRAPAGKPFSGLCPICRLAARPGGILWYAKKLLSETPWIDEKEFCQRVPELDPGIYHYVWETLCDDWKTRLDQAFSVSATGRPVLRQRQNPSEPTADVRDLALRFIMLKRCCPAAHLTRQLAGEVLGPYAEALFDTGI